MREIVGLAAMPEHEPATQTHDPGERATPLTRVASEALEFAAPGLVMGSEAILALQRTAGNQAVCRLVAGTPADTPRGLSLLLRQASAVGTEAPSNAMAKVKLNYARAKTQNVRYSKPTQVNAPNALGWATKLAAIPEGAALQALWSRKDYNAFARAVAERQLAAGVAPKAVDGILGPATWSRLAGLGEAMASVSEVHREQSEALCYEATEERLRRGYQLATGSRFEFESKEQKSTFDTILASFPGKMLDVEEQYRGSGAAGALVHLGLGSFVAGNAIWTGALKPGAALQVWKHRKAYDLLRIGEVQDGKTTRRLTNADADFYGTSFVFVRYDSKRKDKILVRHFGSLEWHVVSDFDVWVAANATELPASTPAPATP
jgi:hypothetical protein